MEKGRLGRRGARGARSLALGAAQDGRGNDSRLQPAARVSAGSQRQTHARAPRPRRAHAPRGSGGGDGRARGARCPHAAPSAGIAASPARRTASRLAGGSGGGSRARWARVDGRGGRSEAAARVDGAEPSKFLAGDVAGRGPLRTPGAVTGRPGRRGRGRPRRSSRTGHGLRRILAEQVQ